MHLVLNVFAIALWAFTLPLSSALEHVHDSDLYSETLLSCVRNHSMPQLIIGSMEDLLQNVTKDTIHEVCQNFQSIVPCIHAEIIDLRGKLSNSHHQPNETVAKYHALYYACSTGRPLFDVRDKCSLDIDQEALTPGGQCHLDYESQLSGNQTEEELERSSCMFNTEYYRCTRNRTMSECPVEAHHLNINIWKLAAYYYSGITRCGLDIHERTVFEPRPLPVKVNPDELTNIKKAEDGSFLPVGSKKAKFVIRGTFTVEQAGISPDVEFVAV